MKNFKWDKKYLYWGLTAFLVVAAAITFYLTFNRIGGVFDQLKSLLKIFSPFIYGLVIAYIINYIMRPVEKYIFSGLAKKLTRNNEKSARRISRLCSAFFSEILAIVVILALLIIVVPQIFTCIVDLVGKSQTYVEECITWLEELFDNNEVIGDLIQRWVGSISETLIDWISTSIIPQMSSVLSSVTSGIVSFVKTFINLLIGIVVSLYLLYNKETFCAQTKKIFYSILGPKKCNSFMKEVNFVNKAFGDYIVGTLLDALIIGVANYIFMVCMRMPYTALVSILVAVMNLIPMFGPFIGAIPSALLILLESPLQCFIFVVFTILLQQVDSHVLKPVIHSTKAGISGVWIVFSIIVFGSFFGVVGMIIGVPIIRVIYSIVRRVVSKLLRRKGMPSETEKYTGLKSVDPETLKFDYVENSERKNGGGQDESSGSGGEPT